MCGLRYNCFTLCRAFQSPPWLKHTMLSQYNTARFKNCLSIAVLMYWAVLVIHLLFTAVNTIYSRYIFRNISFAQHSKSS